MRRERARPVLLLAAAAASFAVVTSATAGEIIAGDSPALQRIVDSSRPLADFGKRARQDVLKEYTWERSRRQLQSVYETLRGT